MASTIEISVTDFNGENRQPLFRFTDFSITSLVDSICDTFSVTLVDPKFRIKVGYYIYFNVNNELILRGLIQQRRINITKNDYEVTLSGKSATSLLVEQYCKNLNDFKSKTPKFIVDSLINQTNFLKKQKVPSVEFSSDADSDDSEEEFKATVLNNNDNREFIRNNNVSYDKNFEALSTYKEFTINAGDMVWNKISEIVTINGYQAYFKPTGDLVIGELKNDRDNAGVNFSITNKRNNSSNSALSASLVEDISDRYTEIQVTTQLENGKNKTVKILDKTAPIEKFMLFSVANDQNPTKIGIETREMQRIDGYQVLYTVEDFTQNQKLWAVNRWVKVEDEFLDIHQNLVVQSRVLNFSMEEGATTDLTLSLEKDLKNKEYPPGSVSGVSVES